MKTILKTLVYICYIPILIITGILALPIIIIIMLFWKSVDIDDDGRLLDE